MPKLAANLTMMFNEVEFLDRFEAAAKSGFKAVEFLFPYVHPQEAIAERLKRFDLTLALFNLPPGNWDAGERGIASLDGRWTEFERSVETALTYALATGARRLHVMSGLANRAEARQADNFRKAVLYACRTAAAHAIDIVIEPINARDMPGYFLNDFGYAADLIAELGEPNLKLQYDIYHRQIIHGDILKSLVALMPIIGHVQIAAVPLRHEPGTGELDDGRILQELDALGYEGYVGCEYRPAGDTVAGLSWRGRLGV